MERTSESSESIAERGMGVSFRIRKVGVFHLFQNDRTKNGN